MKEVTILSLLVVFATTSFYQSTDQQQSLTQTNFLQKSKKQKKVGWVLLAGGAALTATSFLITEGEETNFNPRTLDYDHKNDGIKTALGLGGIASMLGSIPFFISSGKNKRKAKASSAFVDMEKIPILQRAVIRNQSFPVVGVRIGL